MSGLGAGERLALLVEGFDPARGGMERAVRALAEALGRSGVPVEVYAPADRAGPDLTPPARRIAVALPHLPRPLRAVRLASALAAAARRRSGARTVACGKLLGAELWWPHGGLHRAALAARAAAGRGPAAALGARALRALRPAEWAYLRLDGQNLAACARGAARAVALSARVRGDLAAAGLDPTRVALVPNGVDPLGFAPPAPAERQAARAALQARAGAAPGAPLLLHLAHDPRLKGLDALLRALPRLAAGHLVVAGGFDPRPWRRLAALHGVAARVTWLGAVADPRPLYRGADLLVHPTRYDPCSLVVLEALACGLPALTSRHDGANELLLAAGAGEVLPEPDDAPALAASLAGLLDPVRREALAARAVAFRRPWERVGQELLALLP